MDEKREQHAPAPVIYPQMTETGSTGGDVNETAHQLMGPAWDTITMAQVYASQGHIERARAIYETILESEPNNAAAMKGLELLEQTRHGA
jgi:hypothetical protein